MYWVIRTFLEEVRSLTDLGISKTCISSWVHDVLLLLIETRLPKRIISPLEYSTQIKVTLGVKFCPIVTFICILCFKWTEYFWDKPAVLSKFLQYLANALNIRKIVFVKVKLLKNKSSSRVIFTNQCWQVPTEVQAVSRRGGTHPHNAGGGRHGPAGYHWYAVLAQEAATS